jgi:predicted HTH transcriptional regulator
LTSSAWSSILPHGALGGWRNEVRTVAYTEQQVRDILNRGETDQVELKSEVREPGQLSRIISGLANSKGGLVVVGAHSPSQIPGCDCQQLTGVYGSACKQLNRPQVSSLDFVKLDGKEVGVIKVEKSDKLVAADNGVFVHGNQGTVSMTADQIFGKASSSGGGDSSIRSLSNLIYDQMITIDRLRHTLEDSHSWKSKAKDFAISGLLGAVFGVILSKLFLK